jgi:hypothetical protein
MSFFHGLLSPVSSRSHSVPLDMQTLFPTSPLSCNEHIIPFLDPLPYLDPVLQFFSATTTAQHPRYRPNPHHTTNHTSKNTAAITPFLTVAALTAYNTGFQSNNNKSQERVSILQKAGRDLGFELPQECYAGEKWKFEEWIEEQGKRNKVVTDMASSRRRTQETDVVEEVG